MCGIAGQCRSDLGPVDRGLIERMCAAIEHRGPDSRGIAREAGVGLGIQRLRVIDLATGDQPIHNEDRSVTVVLNGEIYNYRELRQGLLARGHQLRTEGDTEVIAHLYEEKGAELVEDLVGMFAFALWDAPRRRLLIGRDRVGKKPLFYAVDGERLSFASELAALLQDPSVPREPDAAALDGFLAFKYVPPPRTAFAAVRSLPPGHTLVYEGGEARVERYWELRYAPRHDRDRAETEAEVRQRLRDAVARRLVADVPLGAFLSGGIDSAAVVAAMSETSTRPVKTFSIGFEGAEEGELPLARVTAERFGTDHHEIVVRADATELIPLIVRHYGQPFADTSALPSLLVSRVAREHVTVALNGDGGDESFGGYEHYLGALRTARVAALPGPVRAAIGAVGRSLPDHPDPGHPLSRAGRLGERLGADPAGAYADAVSIFTRGERARLYAEGFRERLGEAGADPDAFIRGPWRAADGLDAVNRLLAVDVATYLPGDLLPKMDVASMAFSLETRSPFLDHELMEFAATIPGEWKIAEGRTKMLLRSALRGWIPDQILAAPKRGFGLPSAAEWLRGELRGLLRDTVGAAVAARRGYFAPDYVEGLVESHLRGERDHGQKLWALMMFELWHREFVDGAPRP